MRRTHTFIALLTLTFLGSGVSASDAAIRDLSRDLQKAKVVDRALLIRTAATAYTILSAVPDKGLKASEDDLLAIHGWAEELSRRDDIRGRMLAIRLRMGIAKALVYEVRHFQAQRLDNLREGTPPAVGYETSRVLKLWTTTKLNEVTLLQQAFTTGGSWAEQMQKIHTAEEWLGMDPGAVPISGTELYEMQQDSVVWPAEEADQENHLLAWTLRAIQDFRDLDLIFDQIRRIGRPDSIDVIMEDLQLRLPKHPRLRLEGNFRQSNFAVVMTFGKYSRGADLDYFRATLGSLFMPFIPAGDFPEVEDEILLPPRRGMGTAVKGLAE